METIGLSQVLRILPVPAFQLQLVGDALLVIDANLPCRMLWPQISSVGTELGGDIVGGDIAEELRRIASGFGLSSGYSHCRTW